MPGKDRRSEDQGGLKQRSGPADEVGMSTGKLPDFFRALCCRVMVYSARDEGQAMIEYALIIALIGLVSIVALQLLDGGIRHTYNVLTNAL